MHPSWQPVLYPLRNKLLDIAEMLKGRGFLPAPNNVLRVFDYPLSDVKVLIVGQDPYPTPGHPVGLSFSVSPDTHPFPRGLQNIVREYVDDLGFPPPKNGDLSVWAERGVFLLNRVLTVRPHKPGSHAGIGWEEITEAAVRALVYRDKPMVSILWGRQAQTLSPILSKYPVIESVHPSPHTAYKGFFGSKPWSKANQLLTEQGTAPVEWQLPGIFD